MAVRTRNAVLISSMACCTIWRVYPIFTALRIGKISYETPEVIANLRAGGATLVGEEEANMAARPDPSPDLPLSSAELAELRRRYSLLSTDGLRQVYADALERCKLDNRGATEGGPVPGAGYGVEGAEAQQVSRALGNTRSDNEASGLLRRLIRGRRGIQDLPIHR
jgi:hypothetical protein